MTSSDTGYILDRFPYARAGTGPRTLVVFPGLGDAMFTDWRAVAYPPMALTVGRLVQPRPAAPTDVSVSLRALREFDAADRLDEISARTLVFGGTDDPFFPERILEETADGIPEAELAAVPGGKHAVFHERKVGFDSRLRAFLLREADAGA